jgi:hypothetical protein
MSFIAYIVIAYILVFVLEIFLSRHWIKWYFHFGIPFYLYTGQYKIPNFKELNNNKNDFVLKEDSPDEYLFINGNYTETSLMTYKFTPFRGYIKIFKSSNNIKIVFIINWHILNIIIIFAYIIIFASRYQFIMLLILLFILFEIFVKALKIRNFIFKSLLIM